MDVYFFASFVHKCSLGQNHQIFEFLVNISLISQEKNLIPAVCKFVCQFLCKLLAHIKSFGSGSGTDRFAYCFTFLHRANFAPPPLYWMHKKLLANETYIGVYYHTKKCVNWYFFRFVVSEQLTLGFKMKFAPPPVQSDTRQGNMKMENGNVISQLIPSTFFANKPC